MNHGIGGFIESVQNSLKLKHNCKTAILKNSHCEKLAIVRDIRLWAPEKKSVKQAGR